MLIYLRSFVHDGSVNLFVAWDQLTGEKIPATDKGGLMYNNLKVFLFFLN